MTTCRTSTPISRFRTRWSPRWAGSRARLSFHTPLSSPGLTLRYAHIFMAIDGPRKTLSEKRGFSTLATAHFVRRFQHRWSSKLLIPSRFLRCVNLVGLDRAIQYPVKWRSITNAPAYWVPAFAGMTTRGRGDKPGRG